MTTYKIWLTYDISLGNDTQADKARYHTVITGLYQWFDGLDAEECTYSVARFSKSANDFSGLKSYLTRELANIGVDEKKGDRIYVKVSEPIELHIPRQSSIIVDMIRFAGFIFGTRRKAPWENEAKGHYDKIDINVPLK